MTFLNSAAQGMQAVDFTFVNLLAELYAESSRHADVLELIKQAELALCKDFALAVDLQVSTCPSSWPSYVHQSPEPWPLLCTSIWNTPTGFAP